MARYVDWVASLAAFASSLIVAALAIDIATTRSEPTTAAVAPFATPMPFMTGGIAPRVTAVSYESADATVLINVSSACPFCTDSMPAFREIVKYARESAGRVQVVAVGAQHEAAIRAYLQRHSVTVNIRTVPSTHALLRAGTPRIVIVTRDGSIVADWFGQLDSADVVINELTLLAARHRTADTR